MTRHATGNAISLSVLDLVPIPSGSTARQAIDNSIELAKRAESAGYHRYWFAEHHLNPGVAGTTPALLIALIANATRTLRVGSGAVLMGHQTPLAVVEQFGILDAVHPGRIDLGLGRSGVRFLRQRKVTDQARSGRTTAGSPPIGRTVDGLLIPPPFSFAQLVDSPRFALQIGLLQQPNAETPDYAEQIDDVLALIRGTYRGADGTEAHVVPGEDAELDVWVLGSSGGDSAEVAGRRGLPFAANYHVAPSSVLDAVEAYRAAFRPSPTLATGYAPWVRSIRSGEGAIAFPAPDEARAFDWSADDQALVQDRLDTQFVGSPQHVADRLEILAAATGADELLITTITHDQRDRIRSYELLADEWASRNRLARVG